MSAPRDVVALGSATSQEDLGEMQDTASQDDNGSSSGSDSDGQSSHDEHEPVESLVAGRERRATAGNKLSTLLGQEEADEDEVTMLFAEEGEDEEFEDPDAVAPSDEADDSDSDPEDQGPAAGDDLEGEKELQKEERIRRLAKKRKNDQTFGTSTKRARIADDSALGAEQPDERVKPRKKSERVSWTLPSGDGTRTSKRTLAVENKARTQASLKESEARRMKQIKAMEETLKERRSRRARPMTQAERLAEAARTERQNSKSLNKWEELEKERLAKQKARLDALQDRRLEGPVLRFHSGPAGWINGKLKHTDKNAKSRWSGSRPSDLPSNEAEATSAPSQDILVNGESITNDLGQTKPLEDGQESLQQDGTVAVAVERQTSASESQFETPSAARSLTPLPAQHPEEAHLQSLDPEFVEDLNDKSPGFLAGIHQYGGSDDLNALVPGEVSPTAEPEGSPLISTGHAPSGEQAEPDAFEPMALDDEVTVKTRRPLPPEASLTAQPTDFTSGSADEPHGTIVEKAARNTITLINFSQNAARSADIQRRILFGPQETQPSTSLPTPSHRTYRSVHGPSKAICAITAGPAKYRDPLTGLPYSNLDAFKAIRGIMDGQSRWSDLLGAWVGSAQEAANGVPEGFVKIAGGEKSFKVEADA